jgi:hypothetical protein
MKLFKFCTQQVIFSGSADSIRQLCRCFVIEPASEVIPGQKSRSRTSPMIFSNAVLDSLRIAANNPEAEGFGRTHSYSVRLKYRNTLP